MSNSDFEKRQDAADIRADHSEQKAAADKFVTDKQAEALVGHVDVLTDEVKDLRTTLTKRNKALIWVAGFILAVGLIFILLLWIALANQDTIKQQGQIIEAVTGCTIHDSQKQCQAKQEKRSKEEGLARLVTVECIGRSIEAGEPKRVTEQKCFPPPSSKPAPALPPPPGEN